MFVVNLKLASLLVICDTAVPPYSMLLNLFCFVDSAFIITPSKSLSVLLGDYISLTCSHIDENLDISYTWVHFNATMEFRVLSENSSMLIFPRIMEEDLGRYGCSSLDLAEFALVDITSASED